MNLQMHLLIFIKTAIFAVAAIYLCVGITFFTKSVTNFT